MNWENGQLDINGGVFDPNVDTWNVGTDGSSILRLLNGSSANIPDSLVLDTSSAESVIRVLSGAQFNSGSENLAPSSGSIASLVVGGVGGADSTLTVSDSLNLGGDALMAGGSALLVVSTTGLVELGRTLRVWGGGTVNIRGGTIQTPSADFKACSILSFAGGTFTVDGGTLLDVADIDRSGFVNNVDIGGFVGIMQNRGLGPHQLGALAGLSGSGVPEPATFGLLIFGCLLTLRRDRWSL